MPGVGPGQETSLSDYEATEQLIDLSYSAALRDDTDTARRLGEIDTVNELMHQQWLDMGDSYLRTLADGGDPIRDVKPTAQFVDPQVALEFIPAEWAKRQAAREQFLRDDPMIQAAVELHDSYMEKFKIRNQGPLAQYRPEMPVSERAVWENQLQREPMPDEVQQQLLDALNHAEAKLQEIDPAMSVRTDQLLGPMARNMDLMGQRQDAALFDYAPPTPTGANIFERMATAFRRPIMEGYGQVADGLVQLGFMFTGGLDSEWYEQYRRQTFAGNYYLTKEGDLVDDGGKISPDAGPLMALEMLRGGNRDEILRHGRNFDENFNWAQEQVQEGLEVYANATAAGGGFLASFIATGGGMAIQQSTRLMAKGAANLLTSGNKKVQTLGKVLTSVGGAGMGTALWEMGVRGRVDGYGHAAIEGMKMGPVFALAGAAGKYLGKWLERFEKMPPRLKRVFEGMTEGFIISQSEIAHLQGAAWNFMRDPTDPDKMREWSVGLVSSMLSFGIFKGMTGTTPGEMAMLEKALKPEELRAYRMLVQQNEAQRQALRKAETEAEVKAMAQQLGVRPQTAREYGERLREHVEGKVSDVELEAIEQKVRAEQYVRDLGAEERATERMEIRETIQRLKARGPHGEFDTKEKLEAEIKEWEELLEMAAEPEAVEPGQMVSRRRRRPPATQKQVAETLAKVLAGESLTKLDPPKTVVQRIAREILETNRQLAKEEQARAIVEMREQLEKAWEQIPVKFKEMAKRSQARRQPRLPKLPREKITERRFESREEYERWQREGEDILRAPEESQVEAWKRESKFITEKLAEIAKAGPGKHMKVKVVLQRRLRKLKRLMETETLGGGKPFEDIARAQRGEPETAMLEAQKVMGGGVLQPALEHAGDLIHRMTEGVTRKSGGYEAVREKVTKLLRTLTHPYGFEKELNENIIANAKARGVDASKLRSDLDAALSRYVEAHRQLLPQNEVQKLANEVAISVGEKKWPRAVAALKTLDSYLSEGLTAWVKRAQEPGELPPDIVGMPVPRGLEPKGVPPGRPGTPKSMDLMAQLQMAGHPAAAELVRKWGTINQMDIHRRMEGVKGDPVRVPLREGVAIKGIGGTKQWMGWYDRRQHLARLRDMRNEAVKAHEWSHSMEQVAIKKGLWDPQALPDWVRQGFAKVAETYPGYDKLSRRDQISEGWAEFWAREALDDPRLPTEVPKLYDYMMDWLNSPQVVALGFERQFTEVQELMRLWRLMGATERVRSLRPRVRGELPSVMEKRAEMSAFERIATLGSKYVADSIVELRKSWKKWLDIAELDEADIPISLNPVKLIDAFAMTAGRQAERMWKVGTHDITGRPTGESAEAVLDRVRTLADGIEEFTDYLMARRMINLIDLGYEMPGRRADLLYEVERLQIKYPEFITYGDQMRQFANRVLDYAVEAGSLSVAERDSLIKTNPVYIPFQRIMEFAGGAVRPGRGVAERGIGVARLKGGPQQLRDPIQAFKESIQSVVTKAQQNMVMRSMYLNQKLQVGVGGLVNEVPRGVEPREVVIERIQDEIVRLGGKKGRRREAERLADELERLIGGGPLAPGTVMTFWFQKPVPTGAKPIIAFRPKFTDAELNRLVPAGARPTKRGFKNMREEIKAEEGEIVWMEVDPKAYNALMGVDQAPMLMENAPAFLRGMVMGPVQLVRLGATIINPSFIIRNLIRDPLTRQLFTKSKGRDRFFFGFGALLSGMAESVAKKKSEGMQIIDALGLEGGTRVGFITESHRLLEKGGIIGGPLRGLRWLAEKMGKPETWLRAREALDVREEALARGASEFDANMEMALAYKEVTVNFTRTGIWGRQISQLLPYFSPRVGGLRKYWRSVLGAEGKDAQTQALIRGFSMLGGISALAWWLGRNEEWYQDLPLWRRVNYWSFKIGDQIVSLSKPFEAGILMGSTVENALTAFDRYDPEMTKEIMTELIAQHVVGWPFIIQPVLPILEADLLDPTSTGYSYFTGAPIVPDWMLKTRIPEDQYNAYTTEIFKGLGQAFGVSPAKLEYMVNQYSGGLMKRMLATGEQWAGINNAAYRMNSIPGIGTLFSQTEHRFSRAEDTVHDIEFQLGRLAGSGLLTSEGRGFRSEVNYARAELRRLRQEEREGRFTAEEANRRAYLLTRRLAERWEKTKMSQYRRETPENPR